SRAFSEEAIAIAGELRIRPNLAWWVSQLGDAACRQCDYDTATALYHESLAIWGREDRGASHGRTTGSESSRSSRATTLKRGCSTHRVWRSGRSWGTITTFRGAWSSWRPWPRQKASP